MKDVINRLNSNRNVGMPAVAGHKNSQDILSHLPQKEYAMSPQVCQLQKIHKVLKAIFYLALLLSILLNPAIRAEESERQEGSAAAALTIGEVELRESVAKISTQDKSPGLHHYRLIK